MIAQAVRVHPLPDLVPPLPVALPPLPTGRLPHRPAIDRHVAPFERIDLPEPGQQAEPVAHAAALPLPPLTAIAHDLRGPLQSLALSAELLLETIHEPEEVGVGALDRQQVARLAATMQRQVLWLQGLVENLHAATTLQVGGFAISPHPTDLGEIVAGVQPVVLPLLRHKAQPLQLALPPALPLVRADGRRIGQVMINLLLNASKYSPAGTPITVTVSRQDGSALQPSVRVMVADRGPGLPPGGAARLFRPYARSTEARRSGVEGMGLGLAIVNEIIVAHGGRVGATPRSGGGTCFWFELPVMAEATE